MKKNFITLLFMVLIAPVIQAQSIKKDIELGAKNAKMVEESMGIYHDSAMTAYITEVGQRLVSHLDSALFTYRFAIIPDPSPNAFSLPGGYIYITTGLLPLIQNEDELAGIIGHEIIHSNNRHTIRQMKKNIFPALLQLPGNIVGLFNEGAGAMLNAPLAAPSALLVATYSRKFENEADREGVALAARSGYDPTALAVVLERMSKAIETVSGNKESKSYFSDHPYTPDRSKRINEASEDLKDVRIKPVSKDFLQEFNGVLYGEDPTQGVVDDSVYLHPVLDFYFKFPDGWKVENHPQAVVGMNEKQNAGIFLMPDEKDMTAEEAAKKFISKLSATYKNQIVEKKSFDFNGKKAYVIRMDEKGYDYHNRASVYWLPLGDQLYRVVGISPVSDSKLLDASILSLRKLTDKEKDSISERYVKVVNAREGETIAELSKRTGNLIKPELTAIMNAKKVDEKLKEGTEIKIILKRPYLGR